MTSFSEEEGVTCRECTCRFIHLIAIEICVLQIEMSLQNRVLTNFLSFSVGVTHHGLEDLSSMQMIHVTFLVEFELLVVGKVILWELPIPQIPSDVLNLLLEGDLAKLEVTWGFTQRGNLTILQGVWFTICLFLLSDSASNFLQAVVSEGVDRFPQKGGVGTTSRSSSFIMLEGLLCLDLHVLIFCAQSMSKSSDLLCGE